MQVKQQFIVPRARSVVWDFFSQIEKVTLCMPGASLDAPVNGNLARFRFSVKFGPIAATFVGTAELERDAQNFRGVVSGSGRDVRGNSRAKGTLEYTLSEEDEFVTRVNVAAEFQLTGALAQFSRLSLVTDLATQITADFAKNVEAAMAAVPAPEQNASPQTKGSQDVARTQRMNELGFGKLLVFALWARFKALVYRIFRNQPP
jgi:carbon monoxide dehydrogenase subunit G